MLRMIMFHVNHVAMTRLSPKQFVRVRRLYDIQYGMLYKESALGILSANDMICVRTIVARCKK